MTTFQSYLDQEWKPALGCTEPACIAYAAASAAALLQGPVTAVHLVCDARMYKNCYAVGIPHAQPRTGIRWATAIGAFLPDPSARLECFKLVDDTILAKAESLLDSKAVTVRVDPSEQALFVHCTVESGDHQAQATVRGSHTRLVSLQLDGQSIPVHVDDVVQCRDSVRAELTRYSFEELIALARSITPADRNKLRDGAERNLAISEHGLQLFPESFRKRTGDDPISRASCLVCAGVYARMCGEDFVVMSLAGSGNKGIVCSVPLVQWGRQLGVAQDRIDEALALACLITSLTTHHLGTLSAVCGCSNAAGIGLSAGLVLLEGGDAAAMSLAINNMVGNVTGMVCDGAKIGCALKTMTSVDAAFRSASLALSGIGIPVTDGIVGGHGIESLANLGRIATEGMTSVDREILSIMQEKLDRPSPAA